MHDDPSIYNQIVQWLLQRRDQLATLIGLLMAGAWGGLMRYVDNQHARHAAMKIGEGAIEVSSSAFVGVVIGMGMHAFTADLYSMCAAAAVAGHLGTRNIFKLINRWIDRKIGDE